MNIVFCESLDLSFLCDSGTFLVCHILSLSFTEWTCLSIKEAMIFSLMHYYQKYPSKQLNSDHKYLYSWWRGIGRKVTIWLSDLQLHLKGWHLVHVCGDHFTCKLSIFIDGFSSCLPLSYISLSISFRHSQNKDYIYALEGWKRVTKGQFQCCHFIKPLTWRYQAQSENILNISLSQVQN